VITLKAKQRVNKFDAVLKKNIPENLETAFLNLYIYCMNWEEKIPKKNLKTQSRSIRFR